MHEGIALAVVGVLVFLSSFFSRLFDRTGIPDIFFLLVLGLLLGPVLHLLQPSDFGIMGPVFTSLTLVLIMFEGGLDLKFDVLKRSLRSTLLLTLATYLVSVLAVGFVVPVIDGISRPQTFILGAIVSSVSPSVVVPIIRQMQMESESKATLAVESALSDALSITVTVALLEIFRLGGGHTGELAGKFIASFAMAVGIGAGGAFIWSAVLPRVRTLRYSLFLTLAFALIVFGAAQWLGFAGYIASLVFGIMLGNMGALDRDRVREFTARDLVPMSGLERTFSSEMVFLLKTFFFVYVGLSIRLDQPHLLLTGLLISLMILVLRLPLVKLTVRRTAPVQDASSMAVMIPKGLATAVLASIPLHQGIPGGAVIQGIAYSTILFSIAITSVMLILLKHTVLSRIYEWLFSDFRHR